MSDKKMPQPNADRATSGGRGKTDPNKIISLKLKALYSSVEQEGIPDRFLDLLEQLDEAERVQSKKDGGNE